MSTELNIGESIEKAFDNFKKVTPALVAITIVSGLILFLPSSILARMALDNIPSSVKIIVGIVFLITTALCVVILFKELLTRFIEKRKMKRLISNSKKKLSNLDPDMKRILRELLKSQDCSIEMSSGSGIVKYLEANGFIARSQNIGYIGSGNSMIMRYCPHPWVIDLYLKEPELFN